MARTIMTDEEKRNMWNWEAEGFTRKDIEELSGRSSSTVNRILRSKPKPTNPPVNPALAESLTPVATSPAFPNGVSPTLPEATLLSETFSAIANELRMMADAVDQHVQEAILIETNQDAFKGIDRLKITLRDAVKEKEELRDQLIQKASVVYSR